MKEGWTYKKLGEVCDIIGGGTPSKKNTAYYDGNIPWATVKDMNCNVLSKTEFKISEEGFNDSASHIIKKGEIIIATRVGLGKVCKLAQDTAINQDLKGIIPIKYDIVRDFIFYYFKSRAKFLEENGVGATVKGVKIKFVEDLLFPIIPFKEQQRIVSRLDAAFSHIDELKANAEKQLSEARALFQKSLAKAMEPKEGWEEKTLTEISLISGDYGLSVSSKPFDGVRYIRITDITDDGMLNDNIVSADLRDSKKKEDLIEGDILFARTGATVGKTLVYKKMFGECLYAGYLIRYRLKTNVILPQFIHYVTHTDEYYKWVLLNQEAAAQPNISAKKYNLLPISYPPLSEQQRIVERLDALSAHVRELEENQKKIISECDALKQALLRKVFE